jgi:hypothetical protein
LYKYSATPHPLPDLYMGPLTTPDSFTLKIATATFSEMLEHCRLCHVIKNAKPTYTLLPP